MLLSCDMEVLQEMCGGLALLAHIIVLFNLYFGVNIQVDSDPKNWDMPQVSAATAVFIYLGSFLSSFKWKRMRNFDTHHHIENTLYALATTLPTISVILSCIGIGSVFWETEEPHSEQVFLIVLYLLNILFLSAFSHILGLWTAPTKKKERRQRLESLSKETTGKTTPPPPTSTPENEKETEAEVAAEPAKEAKVEDNAEVLPDLSKAFPG